MYWDWHCLMLGADVDDYGDGYETKNVFILSTI